jgi:alpha-beta hydrolase superfamily lysophospholipase
MRTWPWEDSPEQVELLVEYGLNKESLETFSGHPIENLEEFFSLNIPLLLVAGGADEVVDFSKNAGRVIEYCKEHSIGIKVVVKPNCKHHPHSLEDVSPIIAFIEDK